MSSYIQMEAVFNCVHICTCTLKAMVIIYNVHLHVCMHILCVKHTV